MNKIVHIGYMDKFLSPLIDLIRSDFPEQAHSFIVATPPKAPGRVQQPMPDSDQTGIALQKRTPGILNCRKLARADKIIFHGLMEPRRILSLALQPWLLKKSYWVIWGWDLYTYHNRKKSISHRLYHLLRKFVFSRIETVVTYIPGDYENLCNWYKISPRHVECLMYPSNCSSDASSSGRTATPSKTIQIQVGHSGHPAGQIEILKKLHQLDHGNIMIHCPLAYGQKTFINRVKTEGIRLFGKRFNPITEFLPREAYMKALGEIDVGIFGNMTQSGMGNMIALLGMGKKVYLRKESTPWSLFKEKGLSIWDIDDLALERITPDKAKRNKERVEQYFSRETLVSQLQRLFED